jgi:hypothetical protein
MVLVYVYGPGSGVDGRWWVGPVGGWQRGVGVVDGLHSSNYYNHSLKVEGFIFEGDKR